MKTQKIRLELCSEHPKDSTFYMPIIFEQNEDGSWSFLDDNDCGPHAHINEICLNPTEVKQILNALKEAPR